MVQLLLDTTVETAAIAAIIFVMMVVVELINVRVHGALPRLLGEGRLRSYGVAALLGLMPGCAGSFMAVTLYGHGALTLGALVTSLIVTVGDEGFLMLSWVPARALSVFAIVLVTGLVVGALTDSAGARAGLVIRRECVVPSYHPGHESVRHFLREHVVRHVLLKHLPRIVAWTFPALLLSSQISELGPALHARTAGVSWEGMSFVFFSGLWGLIPASGPHIFIVKLFRDGVAPLSVMVSNSISQSGHALLPLLAISWKDVVWAELIGLTAAVVVGTAMLAFGL